MLNYNAAKQGSKVEHRTLKIKIIEYLEKKPMATQRELQEMLNETRTHIQGAMKELVNEGVIERKGGKKFGFWEIKR